MSFEQAQLHQKLRDAELRLRKAKSKIASVEEQMRECEVVYRRAVRSKKNALRYSIKQRIAVILGE